jgi:alpha-L-rhamnosidase
LYINITTAPDGASGIPYDEISGGGSGRGKPPGNQAMTSRRALLRLVASAPLGPALLRGRLAWAAAAGTRETRGLSGVRPHNLRVEWRRAPVGIDTSRPRFTWTLAAHSQRLRSLEQRACRIIVGSSRAAARSGRGDIWDSGRLASAALRAVPDHDLPLVSQTPYWWAVQVWDGGGASTFSEPASFTTGLMSAADWRARWIAAGPDWAPSPEPPPAINRDPPVQPRPMPLLRREFRIDKPLRRAVLSLCGLGQHELRINGRRASASVLDPGWTDYRKTVLYDTLEVSRLLRAGRNTLAVLLGNGFYNVEKYPGRYTKLVGSFGRPKLLLQLRLAFADGTEELIVSDGQWRTRSGPIVLSSVYGGEDFDARLEPEGWDRTGFADDGWAPAAEVRDPGGALRAQGTPPIAVARTLAPVARTLPRPGVLVYDLGENFAGWPAITVRGRAGRRVKLLPGELLDAQGLVSQRSANARPGNEVSFSYTLAGTGVERWRPRFSYYGFRYIQVEGALPPELAAAGEPQLLEVRGEFLHTRLDSAGVLDTGNPLLQRIHGLILQALLSNTFSVLTDCPQREKLGWLEQTYLNADTVFYNEDAVTLYEKMLRDMMDSQLPDGLVPAIAPEYVAFLDADGANSAFRDSPEWGAAIVLSPWAAYCYTGERRILETGYPAMCRYADYLGTRAHAGLLDYGLGDWYDIGPNPPGESQLTSKALTATVTYCLVLITLSAIARLLGNGADARRYSRRAVQARQALNSKLFDPAAGSYDRGSMTANAMPLAAGLVPPRYRNLVLERLIADIRAHRNHVTSGDIGFHYVVLALMRAGRGDALYEILTRVDPPSYGDQLAQGATALTESWNASPFSSQNHFMLGHAETWLYGGLAGIRIDMHRAFEERIRIAPQPVAGIDAAAARYNCSLGRVASAWRKEKGKLLLRIEVPPGAQARIELPTAAAASVRESGIPLQNARGIHRIREAERKVFITVGSGVFELELPFDA